ncbi:hypothetical protein ACVDG8_001745 [Mesorhizobium sp. ORM8.1]
MAIKKDVPAKNVTVAEAFGDLRSQLAEIFTQHDITGNVEVELAISFKVTEGTGSAGKWFLDISDAWQERGEAKHKVKLRLEPRSFRDDVMVSGQVSGVRVGKVRAGGDLNVESIVRNEDYKPPKKR